MAKAVKMTRRRHPTILQAAVARIAKRRGFPQTDKQAAKFIIEVMRESRSLIAEMEKQLMNDRILSALGA